jgi:hypothetical protein
VLESCKSRAPIRSRNSVVTTLACLAHVKDLAARMPPTVYLNEAAGTIELVVAGIVAEVAIPKVLVADML